jgi:hypothetical protein
MDGRLISSKWLWPGPEQCELDEGKTTCRAAERGPYGIETL